MARKADREALEALTKQVEVLTAGLKALQEAGKAKPDPAPAEEDQGDPDHLDLARREYALRQVLAKHNIAYDVDKADLSALSVSEDGTVSGEFEYEPVATRPAKKDEQVVSTSPALTMDDIRKMDSDEINARWEEVGAVLSESGKAA